MAKELSLMEFVTVLTEAVVAFHEAKHEMLEAGAEIIEKEAKRVIGTYDYGWPELAPSTQSDRESKGFEPDEPLLRTGDLRDSISHEVDEDKAIVGSTSDIAVYQELGTSTIPPRPFLTGAAMAKADEVAKICGGAAVKAFCGQKHFDAKELVANSSSNQ